MLLQAQGMTIIISYQVCADADAAAAAASTGWMTLLDDKDIYGNVRANTKHKYSSQSKGLKFLAKAKAECVKL